jgi:hypothetical protein
MSIFQARLTRQMAVLVKSVGRRNDFHLEPTRPWKGNQPSRRAPRPDMFVISTPRRCGLCVYGLTLQLHID